MKFSVVRRGARPGITNLTTKESRGALRLEIGIDVTLSGSLVGRHKAELLDLSMLGCRIASVSNYPVGTTVIVTIPGLSAIGAEVRWSDVAHCGLRFNAPLHPLVADRIIAQARAQA